MRSRSTIGRVYGWHPDAPDHRDHIYEPPKVVRLAPRIDLRQQCPKDVYDQGQLGACTANSIACAMEVDLLKQGLTDFTPSRLFVYYNERAMEGTVGQDAGAQIRDGVKSVATLGAPPEALWPYSDANPGPFTKRPPKKAFAAALSHKITSYQRVEQALAAMKTCLATKGPFVFGFTVYESFESAQVAKTGVVPMPSKSEKPVGGHAVLAVGYDDASERFIVRNSWGKGWGLGGYFTIPYAYLLDPNLSSDSWTLTTIAG
jgi:C1A family cysteine protease